LTARGHQVAWAGNSAYLAGVLPPGCTVYPVDAEFPGEPLSSRLVRWRGLRAANRVSVLLGGLPDPLAHSMVPGIRAAVDEFAPDVVLADQQALAGALVARERKLPWATSATTTAELTGQYETMPKLGIWAQEQLTELQADYGVNDPVDLRFSDQLVLAFSSVKLLNPPSPPVRTSRSWGRRSVVAALHWRSTGSGWIRTAGTCWCRWGRSTRTPATASSPSPRRPSRRWPAPCRGSS